MHILSVHAEQSDLDASFTASGGFFSSYRATNLRLNEVYRDNIERAHSLGVSQADAPVYLIIWGRNASYARAMARLLSDLQMDTATRCAYPHGRFMVSWTAVTDVPGDVIDAATNKLPGSVPFAQWRSGQVRGQPRSVVRKR